MGWSSKQGHGHQVMIIDDDQFPSNDFKEQVDAKVRRFMSWLHDWSLYGEGPPLFGARDEWLIGWVSWKNEQVALKWTFLGGDLLFFRAYVRSKVLWAGLIFPLIGPAADFHPVTSDFCLFIRGFLRSLPWNSSPFWGICLSFFQPPKKQIQGK